MKYLVQKEVTFNNGFYRVGEILETELPVAGLTARGILKVFREPKLPVAPVTPVTSIHEESATEKLLHSKDYDDVIDIKLPAPKTRPQPSINVQKELANFYPQAQLNLAQDFAEVSVREAADTIKKSSHRKAKEVEMTTGMVT